MINPAMILKFKDSWDRFVGNHPKFPQFIKAINKGALQEGSIVEIKVVTPDGKEVNTNIKVSASDVELFHGIGEFL